MFLVLYDGATHLVTAEAVQRKRNNNHVTHDRVFSKISNQPKGCCGRSRVRDFTNESLLQKAKYQNLSQQDPELLGRTKQKLCKTAETPF